MSKAQSVSEYSICVVIIILALVAMQVYVKRGLQGRYAEVVDFATTQAKADKQYEPYYQKEDLGSTQDASVNKNVYAAGQTDKVIIKDSSRRQGTTVDLINYEANK